MTAVRNIVRGVVRPVVRGMTEGVDGISFPPILSDGNTVAWFDFLQNITKDGSDFVSVWGDKSGNGNDLLQAAGTNQPLWTADGVLFDGIDNFLKAIAFTYNQPESVYIVLKHITWTGGEYFFDGNTTARMGLQQIGSSPLIGAYAGASSGNVTMALNTFSIVRLLANGVSSKLQVNEDVAWTGNLGTNDAAGFTLGMRGDVSRWSHIQVKEPILRKIVDIAPNNQAIYDYLANKYSIS